MPDNYFAEYSRHVIGHAGIIYADWAATGRAYLPIENYMSREILPFIGNTHTASTITGNAMSNAYAAAKEIVKAHVNAGKDDVLLFCGSGMTAAVNKLQRILGMKHLNAVDKPVVFVTAMEHHSNHISWLETNATVEIIGLTEEGMVDIAQFMYLLETYKDRSCKIAAVTACSNVTGIFTPYYEIAKLIHRYGGWCFVDFAAAAPYCDINMHGEDDLDAIYFSPHKFLGGPGTPGVLVFNKNLYRNTIPDQPGGGTVLYTNPWGTRDYIDNIELREDGGTPPFLQSIKAAMCIKLKEEMGTSLIMKREQELLNIIFARLLQIKQIQVLQQNITLRTGIVSFTVTGMHYNLMVKLLNDRFGIQVRGGCSCAGTYGHLLLNMDRSQSYAVRQDILNGDLSSKPGWVRLSIHPIVSNEEINYILDAIEMVVNHAHEWTEEDSIYNSPETANWFDVKNWLR